MCSVSPKSSILILSCYALVWENTQIFFVKILDVNPFIKKDQDSEKQTKKFILSWTL